MKIALCQEHHGELTGCARHVALTSVGRPHGNGRENLPEVCRDEQRGLGYGPQRKVGPELIHRQLLADWLPNLQAALSVSASRTWPMTCQHLHHFLIGSHPCCLTEDALTPGHCDECQHATDVQAARPASSK